VCIVDKTGKIISEVKVASEPNALLQVLKNTGCHFKRIGLEADRCRNGYSVRLPNPTYR
jgi:transposase